MTQLTLGEATAVNRMNPPSERVKLGTRVRNLEAGNTLVAGTDTQMMICGADGIPAPKTISGDITNSNAGVVTLGSGKVTYAKLDANTKAQVVAVRIAADALAADTWERALGYFYKAVTVLAAGFIPDTGFGQATNFATIAIQNKGVNGNGTTAIASKAFSSAVDDFVPTDLGTITNSGVTAGQVLTVKATKTLTGEVIPAGLVYVVVARAE